METSYTETIAMEARANKMSVSAITHFFGAGHNGILKSMCVSLYGGVCAQHVYDCVSLVGCTSEKR